MSVKSFRFQKKIKIKVHLIFLLRIKNHITFVFHTRENFFSSEVRKWVKNFAIIKSTIVLGTGT